MIKDAEANLRKPQAPTADAINSLDHFIACLTAWFYVVLMVATDELLLSCSILTFLQHIQHSYIRVCVTDLANYAKYCLSVSV